MKKLKEIIDYLKLRHRAKEADYFAHITNGMCFRLVPPSYMILHGVDAVWKEVERQEDEALKVIEECNPEAAADIREYMIKDRAERAERRRLKALQEAKEQEEAERLAKGEAPETETETETETKTKTETETKTKTETKTETEKEKETEKGESLEKAGITEEQRKG